MKRLLPQNSRSITAVKEHTSNHANKYLIGLAVIEAVLLVIVLCFSIRLYMEYKQVKQARVEQLKQLISWEKLINKYPNYPDVYYNAAIYAERVGDSEKALGYVNKSLHLNPDFEAGKKLQKEILGNN